MPLRRASRGSQFINTSPPEERPLLLKSMDVINTLPEDSEDIHCSNIINRYAERPSTMNHLCLADFVSLYDLIHKPSFQRSSACTPRAELPKHDMDDNLDDDPYTSHEHEHDMSHINYQMVTNCVKESRRKLFGMLDTRKRILKTTTENKFFFSFHGDVSTI